MELQINSFEDLINVIENNDFDKNELELLIWHTLKSIVFYESKKDLLTALKDYWSKWKDAEEKPLFIGLEDKEPTFDKILENSAFKNEVDKLEAYY